MSLERKIHIIADYGEERSGIPEALSQAGCDVEVRQLKAGDYLINDQILVERKTNTDFIQTLISNRLFKQCYKLKETTYIPSFLIEGTPYKTAHHITREALRGALASIAISWQIPINYTSGIEDTVSMLMLIANQYVNGRDELYRKGYKPKSFKKQQLYFLQGLPLVSSHLASDLLKHFGSLQTLLQASESDLLNVPGIGKKRAQLIREFLNG